MKKLGNVLGAPAKMRVSALGRQRSVCSRTMRGKLGWAAAILLLLLTAAGGAQSTPALAQSNPTTQIGFILDGSGSIGSDNWTTITAGLAEALRNPMCVPQDGSVEFTLTVFGHGADVLIPHETIEDDGMANRIADFVERLDYPDESTNIAEGLVQTAHAMRDSPNFSPELKQAVNLVTDGAPNGTTDGTTCNENDPVDVIPCQRNTEEAREYLLETLEMTPDQDELDSEFIGARGATSDWLKDSIVFPQPGTYADPADENSFNAGWLLQVDNAEEFAQAVCTKFQQIIDPPTPPAPPPAPASCPMPKCNSCGDVHIHTPDGLIYDYQDAGDFLAVQSSSGDVIVQARQEIYPNKPKVSINTAVAFLVAGDQVEFYMRPDRRLYVNGVPYVEDEMIERLSADPIELPNGGTIELVENTDDKVDFKINWPDSCFNAWVSLVSNKNPHIDYGVAGPEDGQSYAGLLGNLDGDPQNDLQVRDGDPIPPPPSPAELSDFGDSWRVDEKLLFTDPPDATPPAANATQMLTIQDIEPADREEAKVICQNAGISDPVALRNCIYDVAVTGDASFVVSAQSLQESTQDLPPSAVVWAQPGEAAPVAEPDAPAAGVAKTGQTACYDAAGAEMECAGTGQDGEFQNGVAWLDPRFTDNDDGTVTDNLTGLIWLQDANCFGQQEWATALTSANDLASGRCGLTDGSTAGDWHLPNVRELQSLIDYGANSPALSSGHPFTNVQPQQYWTGSSHIGELDRAWFVGLKHGYVNGTLKDDEYYVWPVRNGQ